VLLNSACIFTYFLRISLLLHFHCTEFTIQADYCKPKTRKQINVLLNTNLKIAFRTTNMIQNILRNGPHNTNIHTQSGIYQLKSHTCNVSYIGQTDRRLELRFKEHIQYITSNNRQLGYALYILHNAHEYGPMETFMTLLHSAQENKRKNTLESYYIN
jgi:hypothetical protein